MVAERNCALAVPRSQMPAHAPASQGDERNAPAANRPWPTSPCANARRLSEVEMVQSKSKAARVGVLGIRGVAVEAAVRGRGTEFTEAGVLRYR